MKEKAAHIQSDLSALGQDDSFLRNTSKYFSPLTIDKLND